MSIENSLQKIKSATEIDLLDRQEFVDRVLTVADSLSTNKKNACYAINGGWGVGKTFVLNMLEKQISIVHQEGSTLPKYLVFRYDCWEYDYYEEPLIAIVATLVDCIDEKINLISSKSKEDAREILKAIAASLAKGAIQVIDEKSGGIVSAIGDVVCEGLDKADKKQAQEKIYDKFIDFREKLDRLRKTIASIAEDQTIVFIVDELDRCLPEYTIKVLERLHHLFVAIPNVQVVLSVDKSQLEHTIRRIYGDKTNTSKYLSKLINFEFTLGYGSLNDEYKVQFFEYMQKFTSCTPQTNASEVDQFVKMVFEGLEIRSQIAVFEKCHLVHDLVCSNENVMESDCCTMCAELLMTIAKHHGLDLPKANAIFSIQNVFRKDLFPNDSIPIGLESINRKFKDNRKSGSPYKYMETSTQRNAVIYPVDLWSILLGTYRIMLGFNDEWYSPFLPEFKSVDFKNHMSRFWQILQIVN